MLKEIKTLNIPPQIKEFVVHDTVNLNDDAYNYMITDMDTGKWYYGYGLSRENEIYWHSSKNQEFCNIFSNPNSNIKYEILCSGSKKAMISKEKLYLSTNNALSNPISWNGNNGITKNKEINYKHIKEILHKVQTKIYPIQTANKDDVRNDKFKQVRKMEHIPGHISMIANEIDSRAGDTSKCDPLIYLEDYYENGDRLGISGNHTHGGFLRSKHGREINYQLIPKKDWEILCENGIKALGLAFNPREIIEKKRTNIEDGIQYCLELHENNHDYWTNDTKLYLKDQLNFKKNHFGKIKKGVEDELKKNDRKSRVGLVFRTYDKNSKYHFELLDTVKRFQTDKVLCLSYSSANIDLRRLIIEASSSNKDSIVCVVHHPTPTHEEIWKLNDVKKHTRVSFEEALSWCGISKSGKSIIWKEMDAWVPDTK
jgi:hypothetical protein